MFAAAVTGNHLAELLVYAGIVAFIYCAHSKRGADGHGGER